jgi:hypothetical protein
MCNPICYKTNVDVSKNKCKYGFPQPLVNETHFNIEMKLLHIKRTNKWLNNGNLWILLASRCNRDFKFIATSDKDNKSLNYYITNYITENLFTLHICIFFCRLHSKKLKKIQNSNSNYN